MVSIGRFPLILASEQKGRAVGFQEYLRIKAAAAVLGVSVNTLRNWERSGKLLAFRHPVNGHRLYKREDLDTLLASVEQSHIALNSDSDAVHADE